MNGGKGHNNNNNETSYTPNGPRAKQQVRSPKRQHQFPHQDHSNENSHSSTNNNSIHQAAATSLSPNNPDAVSFPALVTTAIAANAQEQSLLSNNDNGDPVKMGNIPLTHASHQTGEVTNVDETNVDDGRVERLDGGEDGSVEEDNDDAPTDMPEERRSIRYVHSMRGSLGSIPSLLLEGMQMLASGLSSSRRSSREWHYRSSSRSSVSSSVGGSSFLVSGNPTSVSASSASGVGQQGSAKNSNANSRTSPAGSNVQTQRSRSSGDASIAGTSNNPHVGGMIDASNWPSSASDKSTLSLQLPLATVPHTVLQPIMSMNTIPDHLRDDDESEMLVMEQLESGGQSSGCVPRYTQKESNGIVTTTLPTAIVRPKPQPPSTNTLANTVNLEASNTQMNHSTVRKLSQEAAIDGKSSEKAAQHQHTSQKGHFLPSVLQPLVMLHPAKVIPTASSSSDPGHNEHDSSSHHTNHHKHAAEPPVLSITESTSSNQAHSSSRQPPSSSHHNPLSLLKSHNHRSITSNIISSFMDAFSSPTDQ